ncbi:MAG: DUF1015 domain-containing protein [bacterium]
MADIKPFKSIYYNSEKVDLKKVVMPPYDIIKDKEVEGYYENDPFNVIRIDKGLAQAGDNPAVNKYTRAADFMNEWIMDNILDRDDSESFYVYTQEYKMPDGKKKEMISFFAAVKIEEYDKRIILPHERTHDGPKADRLELMRSTYSNTSPILAMYPDKEKKIHKVLLERIKKQKPFISFKDLKGIQVKLWKINNDKEIQNIISMFKNKQLYIADGHHRYETAMFFRNEMRKKTGVQQTPYDRILMCLISVEHSNISILPTHRVFKTFRDFDPKSDIMKKYFKVTKLTSPAALKKVMMKKTVKKYLGILQNKKAYLLELKQAIYKKLILKAGHVMEYYMLSPSVLHTLIFDKLLGVPEKEIFSGITYTQDMDEAINYVMKDGFAVSFLVQPATTEDVKIISQKKEVMPQKSTYFMPKLITGLLINKMN